MIEDSMQSAALSEKEMKQLRNLHLANSVYASENEGGFILPSDLERTPVNGHYIPGIGQPQLDRNYTAAMGSALIMLRYVDPDSLVSPSENNPSIGIKGEIEESSGKPETYDFEAYSPADGVTFDRSFRTNLDDQEADHMSYANLTQLGDERMSRWHDNAGGDTIIWSTRGIPDGDINHPKSVNSPILQMHSPSDQWSGHIVCADGSVHSIDSVHPDNVRYDGQAVGRLGYHKDNIFHCEFSDKVPGDDTAKLQGDMWMTYSHMISPDELMVSATFD